ncbi:MAG: hypothetical protein AAGA68_19290 [Pseudomonadota bacterium]
MDYETFFEAVRSRKTALNYDGQGEANPPRLSNEALFHLPLLAIAILVLAKDRRKPPIDEIGQLVGECLERSFPGFKGSSQHLGWSANLRMRTVRALTFLETAQLVSVDQSKRRIGISNAGKAVINRALALDSDLAYTLRLIERHYRNISSEKQISLGL